MAAIDDLRARLRDWLTEQPGIGDVRESAGSPEILWADLAGEQVYVAAGPYAGPGL